MSRTRLTLRSLDQEALYKRSSLLNCPSYNHLKMSEIYNKYKTRNDLDPFKEYGHVIVDLNLDDEMAGLESCEYILCTLSIVESHSWPSQTLGGSSIQSTTLSAHSRQTMSRPALLPRSSSGISSVSVLLDDTIHDPYLHCKQSSTLPRKQQTRSTSRS